MSYRIIPPGHAVEVTMSIEQGLLMSANILMKLLIESALARAQELQPVIICHYLVESTHIHMLLVVQDPAVVRDFVERFKTESAHYMNRLLGRRKRTVWCESYFCAPILTASSVREKIAYIYTNPAKDGLESSIENYPGLSSWQGYTSGRHKKNVTRVNRMVIPFMPERAYSQSRYRLEVKKLKRLCREQNLLQIEPDAWMNCFSLSPVERAKQNELIQQKIKEKELWFDQHREGDVIGALALKLAHMDTEYMPQRDGKQMWCICDDKELRIRYIEWAKDLKEKARKVYEAWKQGDFSLPFPPGVFAPTRPMLANLAPAAVKY